MHTSTTRSNTRGVATFSFIRSERLLCREVQMNLAYRWFCGLSIEDKIRTIRRSRARRRC
jgi:transposase